VTIVFTDLEDSTRRWEDDPDIMDAALARHDAILHAEVERFGGVVSKHRGDGVMAIFDRPADAVKATVAAQLALRAEPWPVAPLRVRMGVHTGEVRSRAGDIFGPDVNLAARIENAAHGGQILVSARTETLVRNALPPLATVTDLGHWALRNVHAPQHLFEVRHESLPARFKRIRAFRPGRSSIPLPPSTYVDTDGIAAQLESTLADARLVTVVGPGGVGKSRLAIEVAIRAEDAYTDGARWCPLADVDDPSLVQAAVASHLDLGGAVPSADVFDVLRDRHLLMLIDNCEHVQTAIRDIVVRILRDCPDVTVLATSREPLRLAGEHVFVVPPMRAEDASGAAPAVTLFLDRAAAAAATIEATAATHARIAALCARLDGLPLAIELAAARTRSLGLDELERRLDERFQLLTSDDAVDASSPLHHRKLRDTVGWSYDLLDERQRLLFERLAVFRGGLTIDAAAAVCGGEVFSWEALADLSERSLVQHDVRSPVTRYELSETMRTFALEKLIERGHEGATAERHAQYFCAWAERADRERSGPNEAEWVERELAEVANLRAATAWAVEHANVDVALRLYVALYELASLQGYVEIFDWLDPFAYLDSGHQRAPAALAMAAMRQDLSTPASLELAQRALALQADTGLPSHRLLPWAKGFAEASRGDRAAAATAYRQGVDLILALEGANGHWVSTRALVAMITRDAVEARAVGVDARHVGQPSGLSNALLAIARTTQAADPTKALELTRRAYAIAESVQNVRLLAYADLTAASIASKHATSEVAIGHLVAALDHAAQARQHEPMWLALTRIGAVLRRAGLNDAANEIIVAWLDAFPGAAARYPSLHASGGGADGFGFDGPIAPSERELRDRTVAIIDRLRRDGSLATPRQDLAKEGETGA
jgi:predicted ATPase/class 3 adenylate cyclase